MNESDWLQLEDAFSELRSAVGFRADALAAEWPTSEVESPTTSNAVLLAARSPESPTPPAQDGLPLHRNLWVAAHIVAIAVGLWFALVAFMPVSAEDRRAMASHQAESKVLGHDQVADAEPAVQSETKQAAESTETTPAATPQAEVVKSPPQPKAWPLRAAWAFSYVRQARPGRTDEAADERYVEVVRVTESTALDGYPVVTLSAEGGPADTAVRQTYLQFREDCIMRLRSTRSAARARRWWCKTNSRRTVVLVGGVDRVGWTYDGSGDTARTLVEGLGAVATAWQGKRRLISRNLVSARVGDASVGAPIPTPIRCDWHTSEKVPSSGRLVVPLGSDLQVTSTSEREADDGLQRLRFARKGSSLDVTLGGAQVEHVKSWRSPNSSVAWVATAGQQGSAVTVHSFRIENKEVEGWRFDFDGDDAALGKGTYGLWLSQRDEQCLQRLVWRTREASWVQDCALTATGLGPPRGRLPVRLKQLPKSRLQETKNVAAKPRAPRRGGDSTLPTKRKTNDEFLLDELESAASALNDTARKRAPKTRKGGTKAQLRERL